ncbi:MAG: hypothetical protein LBT00_12400 [Spirochaetaceae bacterium]|nr:hypothetical protein [Spirochaetaceae bacterium]
MGASHHERSPAPLRGERASRLDCFAASRLAMTTPATSSWASPSSLRANHVIASAPRHCERSAAIQGAHPPSRLLRHRRMPPPRNDDVTAIAGKPPRHCERSEAIQCKGLPLWITSPLTATMLPPPRNDNTRRIIAIGTQAWNPSVPRRGTYPSLSLGGMPP